MAKPRMTAVKATEAALGSPATCMQARQQLDSYTTRKIMSQSRNEKSAPCATAQVIKDAARLHWHAPQHSDEAAKVNFAVDQALLLQLTTQLTFGLGENLGLIQATVGKNALEMPLCLVGYEGMDLVEDGIVHLRPLEALKYCLKAVITTKD